MDMHLGHLRAAHGDGDRVSPGVARIRLEHRKIVVLCRRVVVILGGRRMMMLMRGWAVVVLRMIVPEILVHVLSRPHGRRNDQGLNQRACDEATHEESLLRVLRRFAEAAREVQGQLLKPVRSSPSQVRSSPSSSMTPSASTVRDTCGSRRQTACIPAARAPATSSSGWSPTKTA